MFSTRLENFLSFSSSLKLSSANPFSLKESKIVSFGTGLRYSPPLESYLHCDLKLLSVNSFPDDNILDKLKAFAEDKINVAQMMVCVLERVETFENIVGQGENAGYQHFLLFPQWFQKASFLGLLKVRSGKRLRSICVQNTRRQILDSSKLKEFADDNFKFDLNGRKLSIRVEKTLGKGEIACYEHFLLFPLYFQKACFPGASKGVIVWEWVNPLPLNSAFWRTKDI